MRRCLSTLLCLGLVGCVKPPEPKKLAVSFEKEAPAVRSEVLDVHGEKLTIEILTEGSGETVGPKSRVSVHYVGRLEDGTQFDSSIERGVPLTFSLGAGNVIRGWEVGLPGMKVGEQRRLRIPPALGYGDRRSGQIPPSSTLIFEIALVDVENPAKSPEEGDVP